MQRSNRILSGLRRAPGGVSVSVVATFLVRVGYVALELLCGLVLARLLKASAYGVYAMAMTIAGLLAVPAALGFDRLLVREISTLASRREWGLLHGVVRRGSQLVAASAVLIGCALAIGALVAVQDAPDLRGALALGGLLVPLMAYARTRQAIMQGLGRIVLGLVPETLAQPAFVLLAAGLLYAVSGLPRSGTMAVGIQACGALTASGLGLLLLHRSLPESARSAVPVYRTGEWLRSALPFVWLLGMNVILINVDTVLVGALMEPADAGIYRTASQMAAFVSFPLTAANLVAAPKLAVLYDQGDSAGLWATARHTALIAIAGALPIAVTLLVGGEFILGLYGPEFTAGLRPLAILTVAYVLNASLGVSGYLLIMTRYARLAAWSFFLAASLQVALALVLIPRAGITGAAIATSSALVLLNVLMASAAANRLRGGSAGA